MLSAYVVCALTRKFYGFKPFQHDPSVKGAHRPPVCLIKGSSVLLINSSVPSTTPPKTRPYPSICLVAEKTTTSTPFWKSFEKSCTHIAQYHHRQNRMSDLTDCVYVDNFQRVVWNRFKKENLCRIAYRILPRRKVHAIYKSDLYTKFRQQLF